MKNTFLFVSMLLFVLSAQAQSTQTVKPNCSIGGKGSSYAVESENGYLAGTYNNDWDPSSSTYVHGGSILEMDDDLTQLAGLSFRKDVSTDQLLKVVDVERFESSGTDKGYVAIGYFESDRNSCDVGTGNNYNSYSSFIFGTNSLTTGVKTKDVQIDFDIATSGGPYYGQTFATDVMFDGTYFVVTGYVALPNGQGTECSNITVMAEADEEHKYLPFVAKYQFSFTAGSAAVTKVFQEVFWTEYGGEKESFMPTRIIQNANNSNYIIVGRWWSSRSSSYSAGVAARMTIQPSLSGGDVVVNNIKPLNDYASIVTQVKKGYYNSGASNYGYMYLGNDLSATKQTAFFRITDNSFITEGDLSMEDPGSHSVNAIDFDLTGCSETQLMILGSRITGSSQEAFSFSSKITDQSTYYEFDLLDNQGTCFDIDITRRHPKMYEPRSLFNKTGGSLIWGFGPIADGALHTQIETDENLQESCDVHNDIDLSYLKTFDNFSQYSSSSLTTYSEDMSTTDNVFDDIYVCTPFFYTVTELCLTGVPNPGNNTTGRGEHIDNSNPLEKPIGQEFSIFPNPADQTIVVESDLEISSIRVYDMSGKGKIVQDGVLSNSFTLDISSLTPGLYNIQISDSKGVHVETFVKQ